MPQCISTLWSDSRNMIQYGFRIPFCRPLSMISDNKTMGFITNKLQELQRQSQTATSASEISAIEKKVAEAKHKIKVLEEANTLR